MRKTFLLCLGLIILSINGFSADYTASQAGAWNDAATWGGSGTPSSDDNVNLNGMAVTITADAICNNLTVTNVVGQVGIADGVTLTVRGVFHASAVLTVDVFSTMHANGILKFTCATLADGAYFYSDNAAVIAKPKNVVIESANPSNTYLFGQTAKNFLMGSGKFTVKNGTKLTVKTIMQLGTGVGNELIIEEGATATFEANVKGDGGNASRVYKITINGTLISKGMLNSTTLELGANGYLNSWKSDRTTFKDWDGWWGAINTPTALTSFGFPTTIILGSNSTIEFSKVGAANVPGLIPGTATTIPYVNLKATGGNTKTVQTNVAYSGVLTVASGTTVALASGKSLGSAGTSALKYLIGGGPAEGSFNFAATGLTAGDITITGTTNFDVSTDNVTYGASATIPDPSGTLASTPVYVRFKSGAAKGTYIENIAITGGGLNVTVAPTGAVSDSYTWQGADGGDWTAAANWNPSRTPSIGDVLTFDGFTGTVINVPSQTIAQLKLTGNANVTLTSTADASLALGGDAGTDLSVPAGSALTLSGTFPIKIGLASGTTGTIGGNVTFTGTDNAKGLNHQITAPVAGLIFANGSIMTAGTNFTGFPFGAGPNGAVVFENGSTYIHGSGETAFGGTNLINATTFSAGSLYKYTGIFGGTAPAAVTGKPGVGGKTYGGTFEVNTTTPGGNSNPASDCNYNNVKVYGNQWAIGGNTNGAVTYIKGEVTVGLNGQFRFGINPGIISPVIFNGTTPQTVLLEDNGDFSNGSGSVMTIANDVTFDGNVVINGTLEINAGKTLTIAAGKTLTLAPTAKVNNAGTITNNGTIVFQSNATDGTATYIGGAIGGTVNVNQSLQHPAGALRTWYVSSPVLETVSPTPALDRIKSFNETANTWSATLTEMEPKKGYLVVPANAANNLMFTGTLNTGNQNITLTGRSGVGAQQGFNLIGNPYPSYLDWSEVVLANGSSILRSSTMWYRTKTGTTYNFLTINGDGIAVPNTATNEIPPMQAFWVRAAEGGSILALTDAMRKHAPASNKLLKAPAVNERTLIRLQVSNGVNSDEAVIYFSENAQNGLDKLDAPKMSNDNVEIPEIYTTLGTEKIVINSMNSIPMDTPIGLGFVAGSANSFSITANEISNIPEAVKVILRDNITLAETDLTDGTASYSFTPEATSTDRFSLIFRSAGATTGLGNTQDDDLLVYYNNGLSIICNNDKLIGSMVSVYNGVGQLMISKEISAKNMKFNESFAPGVYVVKTKSISKKVIVK